MVSPRRWFQGLLGLPLILLVLVAVACGASAAPTLAPAATAPAVAPTSAPLQLIATPAPTALPADVVNPGKVVVMVGGFGSENFLPRYCSGECHSWGRLLHGYFVTTTHQGGVIPSAMESWKVSADGKVWNFKLRKGIKFHNGDTATIEDVLFSEQRSLSDSEVPAKATPTQTVELRLIEKEEITGPDELTITYKNGNAAGAVFRSDGHAGNSRMNLLPRKLLLEPYADTEAAYNKLPVGSGPFKMTSRSPAQSMSFERFDDYYYQPKFGAPEDRRPRFKFLDLVLVPELSTRVAALRAGQADIVEAAEAVKNQVTGSGGRLIYSQESNYVALQLLGCWKPEVRCSDIRVRQALNLAIDRKTIQETLYTPTSYAMAGWGFVTPTSLGWSKELTPPPYDPVKARELFQQAGYKVPGSATGKEFGAFVLNGWNAGDPPFIPDVAQLVAETWKKELGIDAQVSITDRTLVTQRWNAQELVNNVRLEVNEARWDPSTIAQARFNDPKNVQRLSEDTALQVASREAYDITAPEGRQAALNKLYLRLQQEQYFLPMGHSNLPWGVSKRIADWKPWPVAAFFNAHWTIRLAQ
ncbi:MAG: ABC transporter substrate-binding protein [Dehalococcoidia bacterium]|nr:ABC transporter substrate-binding protein [Dehalococcoidia bacterium]MSQ16723.1 ABC transporter substrate-binding protein [Dehalococcoidia bacterium]